MKLIAIQIHSAMATSYLDVILLTIFLLVSCYFLPKRIGRGSRKLPPGPSYWPLLGNMFHVELKRRNKSATIQSVVQMLEAKYGAIFTLRKGSRPFIMVTSAQLIREALVEKGHIFSTRPPKAVPPSIGSTPNGAFWRSLRKNMATAMMHPLRIKSFRHVRERTINALIQRLNNEAAQNGGAVTVSGHIRTAVFGILLFMCFGFEMGVEEVWEFQAAMEDMIHKAKVLTLDYNAFPLLNWFAFDRKQREEIVCRGGGLVFSMIQKRRQMISEGSVREGGAYLDTLVALRVSDAEMVGLCSEFVHAGSHTTALTLQFALANLITFPQIQSKLHADIGDVVGRRTADMEDVEKMEYLEAVVMETLRRHLPGYFTLSYAVTNDCTLGGYHIPAGATLNLYIEAMTKDPNLWEKPWDFVPERFLGAEVDVTGTKDMKMIPFGSGRRICPGMGLAMLHLRLILARLVQSFEWECVPNQTFDMSEEEDFVEVMSTTLRSLRSPLKVFLKERGAVN